MKDASLKNFRDSLPISDVERTMIDLEGEILLMERVVNRSGRSPGQAPVAVRATKTEPATGASLEPGPASSILTSPGFWAEDWGDGSTGVSEPTEDLAQIFAELDRGRRKLWLEHGAAMDTPALSSTTAWSSRLFSRHTLPTAAYLDPSGYERLMALKRRNTRHWQEACPNTFGVGTVLLAGIVNQQSGGGRRRTETG